MYLHSPSSDDREHEPSRSRQKPGSACEECRKRKLRCDRIHPRCGVCSDSGVTCTFRESRPPRGPKKGHLKALKSRIAALEHRLAEQQGGNVNNDPSAEKGARKWDDSSNDELELPLISDSPILEADATITLESSAGLSPQGLLEGSQGIANSISDLMRADLDQLYFDRVHEFAPILHRRRYFSWAKQPIKSESQTFLQYAMWTLAASLSTQFQHIQDSMYTGAKQMLETIELNDNQTESLHIEQVQAWVLLTIYEFMRVSYRRGWMSAGRVFRLVQLMRLYEVDEFGAAEPTPACIVSEEKRRAFWMAYLLDRLVSIRNGCPLTLVEQIVSTRLPAPEMNFQSNKPFQTSFLSEAIAFSEHTTVSPFQKCIIVVTICGRAMTHHQQSKVECVYKSVSEDFWNRHQWLETLLTQQELILSLEYPSASEHVDPTMLFIDMTVHATVLYLYKIVESMPWKSEYYQELVLECQQRALTAALHMITLTKPLSQLSCFKIHPFSPILLFLCAEFLLSHADLDKSFWRPFQEILDVFQELKSISNLAETFLHDLDSQSYIGRDGNGSLGNH